MFDRKEIRARVGKNIRQIRLEAGISQVDLARRIDTTNQFVSDVERGVGGLSIWSLIYVCHALQVPSDQILFGRDDTEYREAFLDKFLCLPPDQQKQIIEFTDQIYRQVFQEAHPVYDY